MTFGMTMTARATENPQRLRLFALAELTRQECLLGLCQRRAILRSHQSDHLWIRLLSPPMGQRDQ